MTTEVWLVQSRGGDWKRDEASIAAGQPEAGKQVYSFHVWENSSTTLTRFKQEGDNHYLLNMGPRIIGVKAKGSTVLVLPGIFIKLPNVLGDVVVTEDNNFRIG